MQAVLWHMREMEAFALHCLSILTHILRAGNVYPLNGESFFRVGTGNECIHLQPLINFCSCFAIATFFAFLSFWEVFCSLFVIACLLRTVLSFLDLREECRGVVSCVVVFRIYLQWLFALYVLNALDDWASWLDCEGEVDR